MKFDDVLLEIGGVGRYQLWVFALICFVSFPMAFNAMGIVFLAARPKFHCKPPAEFYNSTMDVDEFEYGSTEILEPGITLGECYITRNVTYGTNTTMEQYKCDSWVYDRSEYSSSIVTEVLCHLLSILC